MDHRPPVKPGRSPRANVASPPRGGWRPSLELDPFAHGHATVVTVPNALHLCHHVGPLAELLGGVAACEHEFDPAGPFVDQRKHFIDRQDPQLDRHVHLVEDDDVVLAAHDRLAGYLEALMGKAKVLTRWLAFLDKRIEARLDYLE